MTKTDVFPIAAASPHPHTGPSRSNYERPAGSTLPAAIPESQLFYWTSKWQADEAESICELDAGEGQTFDNADEAIRWLLDPDD